MGYSPWSCKELDTTEQLTHTQSIHPCRVFSLFHLLLVHWLFVAAYGPPLAVVSGGYPLAAALGLLIVVASLVAEHRLEA